MYTYLTHEKSIPDIQVPDIQEAQCFKFTVKIWTPPPYIYFCIRPVFWIHETFLRLHMTTLQLVSAHSCDQ